MMHAVISDTHSPRTINKALKHLKILSESHPDLDSVVINGDLLGIFSYINLWLNKKLYLSVNRVVLVQMLIYVCGTNRDTCFTQPWVPTDG